MANTKSAQKAHRQSERRKVVNNQRAATLKTSVKKLRTALDQKVVTGQTVAELDVMLKSLAAQLARAKSKKLMKKNTASRVLSRLARRVASVKKEASA